MEKVPGPDKAPRRSRRGAVVVIDGKLECNVCGEVKPVTEFYKNSGRSSGYHSACKICFNVREVARSNARSPESKHRAWLKFKFNITREFYLEMLETQNGVCALCKQPETQVKNGKVLPLGVDHDHACCAGVRSCGKCVRQLLCLQCNHVVGVLENKGVPGAAFDEYIARHAR